jgi:LuxR family maltose regulon positive regulatory protein
LVTAPAGYGKTTFLVAWVQSAQRPFAWLSLDAYDDDIPAFLGALVAAIQTAYPSFGHDILALLRLLELPPTSFIANSIVNAFADLGGDLALVLDDYHAIEAPEVHALVGQMVQRLPSNVMVALGTRRPPPFPLASLQLRGQMRAVGIDLLRFTVEEASSLLSASMHATPDGQTQLAVLQQAEGWPAGVRLLALRDSSRPPAEQQGTAEPGSQAAQDFLIEQVLALQPPDVQRFLLATCICERFCADLCDALTGDHASGRPSQALLDDLRRYNLFLVPLDRDGTWHRFHHLFRDTLRRSLRAQTDAAEIATLHERAGAWFARQGLIEDAIRYYLAGGHPVAAARLVEEQFQSALNRLEWHRAERWLLALPAWLMQSRPGLLLAMARISIFRSQYEKVPPLIEAAAVLIDQLEGTGEASMARVYRADAQGIQAAYAFVHGDALACLAHAERALADLPPTYSAIRAAAVFRQGQALSALGNVTGAVQRLKEARQKAAATDPVYDSGLLLALKDVYRASGALQDLDQTCRELFNVAATHRLPMYPAHANAGLAFVFYEWNQPELAREYSLAVLAQPDPIYYRTVEEATFLLACSEQALGHPVAARQALQDLLDSPACLADVEHLAVARAAQARLAILQGDLPTALRWLHTTENRGLTRLAHEFESPAITRQRVLLERDTEPATAKQALAGFTDLAAKCEARHDVPHLIEVLTLQALAHRNLEHSVEARATLERALTLAEPGRFVRTFLDCGLPLRALLMDLAIHGNTMDSAKRLLTAFNEVTGPQAVPAGGQGRDILMEPLTTREIQILEFMAARLSNKEIAARLYISWHTVSRHATNLTQKLGVKGRRAAVARGRALGFI